MLVVASSGAGKSTLAKKYPTSVIDGDKLTYAQMKVDGISIPHRFWEDETAKRVIGAHVESYLERALRTIPKTKMVVFNHDLMKLSKIASSTGHKLILATISDADFARNMKSRAAADPTGKQPTDPAGSIAKQRQRIKEAAVLQIPVVTLDSLERLASTQEEEGTAR